MTPIHVQWILSTEPSVPTNHSLAPRATTATTPPTATHAGLMPPAAAPYTCDEPSTHHGVRSRWCGLQPRVRA